MSKLRDSLTILLTPLMPFAIIGMWLGLMVLAIIEHAYLYCRTKGTMVMETKA